MDNRVDSQIDCYRKRSTAKDSDSEHVLSVREGRLLI